MPFTEQCDQSNVIVQQPTDKSRGDLFKKHSRNSPKPLGEQSDDLIQIRLRYMCSRRQRDLCHRATAKRDEGNPSLVLRDNNLVRWVNPERLQDIRPLRT